MQQFYRRECSTVGFLCLFYPPWYRVTHNRGLFNDDLNVLKPNILKVGFEKNLLKFFRMISKGNMKE